MLILRCVQTRFLIKYRTLRHIYFIYLLATPSLTYLYTNTQKYCKINTLINLYPKLNILQWSPPSYSIFIKIKKIIYFKLETFLSYMASVA